MAIGGPLQCKSLIGSIIWGIGMTAETRLCKILAMPDSYLKFLKLQGYMMVYGNPMTKLWRRANEEFYRLWGDGWNYGEKKN